MTNASPPAKKFGADTSSPHCDALMATSPTTSVQMDVEIYTGETGDPENPRYFDLVLKRPDGFGISERHRCMNSCETRAREAKGSSGTVKIVYEE